MESSVALSASCLLVGRPLAKVHLSRIGGYIKCIEEIFAHLSHIDAELFEGSSALSPASRRR